MNYTFTNLLGAPYRGGSILIQDDTLLCPAGNRIREVDLRNATSLTHRQQNPQQVETVALSPDGGLLLSIDTSGHAFLILRRTQVLLHRWTLKGECKAASFSHDGAFIAIAVGKLLQVSSASNYRGDQPVRTGPLCWSVRARFVFTAAPPFPLLGHSAPSGILDMVRSTPSTH